MSDFLTRLVQRQRGELPTLAPLMPSAFSGVTGPSSFDATEQATLVRVESKTDQRVVMADDERVSYAQPLGYSAAPEQRNVSRTDSAPAREAPSVLRPSRTEHAGAPDTPARGERRSMDESTTEEPHRVAVRTDQVAATVPMQTIAVDHTLPPSHVPAEPRVRRVLTQLVTHMSSGSAAATPLAAPLSVFERRAESGRPRDEQPPSPEAPVQVTIGRIEIAAMPAPAAPRRALPPRKPAMSLNEYLARRRGDKT